MLFNTSLKLPLPNGKSLNNPGDYDADDGAIDTLMNSLVEEYLMLEKNINNPDLQKVKSRYLSLIHI